MLPTIARQVGSSLADPEFFATLEGERVAVMLFGSFARGDAHASSDVDILQLVERWRPSYSSGRFSVSVYTCEHLSHLAHAGSLFVLHLLIEGAAIEDSAGRLRQILSRYRPPRSYRQIRENLRRACSVLDVDQLVFQRNPSGFLQVAFYLLRTALYARCAEIGAPVFAIPRVAQQLEDPRITHIFQRRGCTTFEYFQEVRSFLCREIDASGANEFGSLEALSVALHVSCPIASQLALKLLSGSHHIAYDSTLLDWSHHE